MFGRINAIFFGAIIGGAAVFGAQRYHFVRAADGIEVVPKMSSTFEDTYVDVRAFSVADWANHKMLAASLATNNKSHVFGDANIEAVNDKFGKVFEALKN